MMQDNCLVMADSVYQRLSPELKAHVDQASRDMEAELRPKVEADDRRILEEIKKKNIVITEVDKDTFRKAVAKIPDEFPGGKRWAERIGTVS
jgi:TRAP-type C4-dicarboxylate transport system substrate-binding protein